MWELGVLGAFVFGLFVGALLLLSYLPDTPDEEAADGSGSDHASANPWIAEHLFGWRGAETAGSNARRVMGRLAYLLMVSALLDGLVFGNTASPVLSALLLVYAAGLFVFKIVIVLVLLPDDDFKPNTSRLLGDVILSSIFLIVAFGYLFQLLGIQYTLDATRSPDVVDHFYFAAVTFSTLGYGDFAPSYEGHTREVASFLAVIGNIHLGLLAGAFMALHKP